jgi:chromosome partitioning protein
VVRCSRSKDGSKAKLALARSLSPIAVNYDIIFIDCPPGNEPLQVAALGAASYVVVPTKGDKAGREGLIGVAKRLDTVIDVNPNLDLLGDHHGHVVNGHQRPPDDA